MEEIDEKYLNILGVLKKKTKLKPIKGVENSNKRSV